MKSLLLYKDSEYNKGTIVRLKNEKLEQFNFCSVLVFDGRDKQNKYYVFHYIYDKWKVFNILITDIEEYVAEVICAENSKNSEMSREVCESYVDGIVSAWIWYIIIMIFGLFLNGLINSIIVWVVASFIFFNWRHKKINKE